MHVKASPVDPRIPLDQITAQLQRELTATGLPHRHLAAEQIASAAIQSLGAGRGTDAALLLAIASYRYREQAQQIDENGFSLANVPNGVNQSAYYGFVKDTRGANLVEYIILVGVIALIAIAGFKVFGTKVQAKITEQSDSVGGINGAAK